MSDQMQAVVQHGYGAPAQVLRVEQVPVPSPGDDDVLVRVRASSVNTPDWVLTTGEPRVIRLMRPGSAIRGSDVAGVVEAVGARVTDLRPGDEVFGSTWRDDRRGAGAFAELTVAPASQLRPKPPGLSFAEAAGAVMSGLTATIAMRGVGPGSRVLIVGASGGIGAFAIQMARKAGATVTGVCGPSNVERVRELGAHRVFDYTREDFAAGSDRYDLVLDNVLARTPQDVLRTLAPGGVWLPNSVGNTGGWFAGLLRMGWAKAFHGGRVRLVTCRYDRAHLDELLAHLASGVKVVIDRRYPLAEAPDAVAYLFGHHARGKVIVDVP